jgi:hypothetical protein
MLNADYEIGTFSARNTMPSAVPLPHRQLHSRSTVRIAQVTTEEVEGMPTRSQIILEGAVRQPPKKGETSMWRRTMLEGPISQSSRAFLFMSFGRNGHITFARLWQKQLTPKDTLLPDLLID